MDNSKKQKIIKNTEQAIKTRSQLTKLLIEKRDYLECLSKLHPSYQFTLGEINQIKLQINNLEN